MIDFPASFLTHESAKVIEDKMLEKDKKINLRQLIEKILLKRYAPSAVIINEKGDILHFYNRTGRYLEPVTGDANVNILGMAREGLKLGLATSIRKAMTQKKEIVYEGLQIRLNESTLVINLIVQPITWKGIEDNLAIVIFEDVGIISPSEVTEDSDRPEDNDSRIALLEHELILTKENLQTTIEELETTNEELQSANEELQSANEELQSTNEELETSKEELQSVNEELLTVNAEHQNKIEALSQANNDLNNLFLSTGIAMIFLDIELNIKRFTPTITKVINLIQSDIGRPLSHTVSNLVYEDLVKDAENVLKTLVFKEIEVQTADQLWYAMRTVPYRTIENVIDGVVITFLDITKYK
jgi:two-component system CheB/CheR fusion protein